VPQLDTPGSDQDLAPTQAATAPRQPWTRSPSSLVIALGVVLLVIGLVGIVRTYVAMGDVQQAALTDFGGQVSGDSPFQRLVPGVISNPGKFFAAVNGGSSSRGSQADAFVSASRVSLKQAMDRWEALAFAGLATILLTRKFTGEAGPTQTGPDGQTSVGMDFAAILLLLAPLFALLSFMEI
jgi:hypothetical protein